MSRTCFKTKYCFLRYKWTFFNMLICTFTLFYLNLPKVLFHAALLIQIYKSWNRIWDRKKEVYQESDLKSPLWKEATRSTAIKVLDGCIWWKSVFIQPFNRVSPKSIKSSHLENHFLHYVWKQMCTDISMCACWLYIYICLTTLLLNFLTVFHLCFRSLPHFLIDQHL